MLRLSFILRLLAFLALGLITTLAVAWSCAMWSTVRIDAPRRATYFATETVGSFTRLIDPAYAHTPSLSIMRSFGFGLCDEAIGLYPQAWNGGQQEQFVYLHRAGWPFPALRAVCTRRPEGWVWASAWTPPKWLARFEYEHPARSPASLRPPIPYSPESDGIVLNTALFALVWSILAWPFSFVGRDDPRSRQLLVAAFIAAVMGLATNIGIAWCCAYRAFSRLNYGSNFPAMGPTWDGRAWPSIEFGTVHVASVVGATHVLISSRMKPVIHRHPSEEDSERARKLVGMIAGQTKRWDEVTPGWARPIVLETMGVPASRPGEWATAHVKAYGWPFRSLCFYETNRADSQEITIIGGLPVGNKLFRALIPPIPEPILPCLPIYRGLALNSTLFSLPWFALFLGLPALRRTLRRRRGQCPACRYDLRGLPRGAPCSECGSLSEP